MGSPRSFTARPRPAGARIRTVESILVARAGAVATVTLNKPGRMNALDKSMWRGLGVAMKSLSADDALRCVVLRGAGGKAFAAGADIAEFAAKRRPQFSGR